MTAATTPASRWVWLMRLANAKAREALERRLQFGRLDPAAGVLTADAKRARQMASAYLRQA